MRRWGGFIAAGALIWSGHVAAQADLFSRETIGGVVDVRLAAADGETSWTDGGFGKSRWDGGGGGFEGAAALAEASLIWEPRLSWELSGHLVAQFQPEQEHGVDLSEAFLVYRPVPRSQTRLSFRAGLYWPQISMEHEDPAWGVTRSITPSAINSWVGEEVKVWGVEASVRRPVGGHELEATAGLFGGNDTSGTLLTFRGWAIHDVKATAFGAFPLPPLSPFMTVRQAPITDPLWEIDGRAGHYVRLGWTPPGPLAFNAFYYDNNGDPEAERELQWGWRTRFWNLGARLDLDDRTVVLAQAMSGSTEMGFPEDDGSIWTDVDFRSAYLLVSRQVGDGMVTGRIEGFEVEDRSLQALDDNAERGWAATAAYRRPIGEHLVWLVEASHVDSDRPSRALAGVAAEQSQTTVQTALRVVF